MTENKKLGVIFDSDGVLVDSEHISLAAFKQAIEEQGIMLTDEDLWQCCGLTDSSIIAQLEKKYKCQIDLREFSKRKFELYFSYAREKGVYAFPGVKCFLEELENSAVPYALASSGPREKIRFNLTQTGLWHKFKVIVSGEDVIQSKPAPDIFLKAAELLQRRPEECIVIEDSPNGLLGAKRAGMTAIALRTTFKDDTILKDADFIFDTIEKLSVRLLYQLLEKRQKHTN